MSVAGIKTGNAVAGIVPDRAAIVRSARAWIGTPYHHQMSVLGVGTDCLGLVRGVWRDQFGYEPQAVPAYSRDWAEATGVETLLEAARLHFTEVDVRDAAPGDVLVFRYRASMTAKHVGLMSASSAMIHACEGGPVCEVTLTPWWRRRLAGAFAFPATPC